MSDVVVFLGHFRRSAQKSLVSSSNDGVQLTPCEKAAIDYVFTQNKNMSNEISNLLLDVKRKNLGQLPKCRVRAIAEMPC